MNEVTEDLQHNIPIQAVDLLLEADMIDSLADLKEVDQTNVWKICQYLLRIVYFHYEASEKEKIFNVRPLFIPSLPDSLQIVLPFPHVGGPSPLCRCHEEGPVCDRHVVPAFSSDLQV